MPLNYFYYIVKKYFNYSSGWLSNKLLANAGILGTILPSSPVPAAAPRLILLPAL